LNAEPTSASSLLRGDARCDVHSGIEDEDDSSSDWLIEAWARRSNTQ
jgi:hypothetical protein